MKEAFRLKTWAGPLTIGSFIVVALTGILMLFHLNTGLSKLAHEWLGVFLVVGAMAHLVVNWRPFLAYFRKPSAVVIMTIFLVLGGISLLPNNGGTKHPPFRAAISALENSSLKVVAQVAKSTPQTLMTQLEAQGINAEDPELTIAQISSANGKHSMEVLGYIIQKPTGH